MFLQCREKSSRTEQALLVQLYELQKSRDELQKSRDALQKQLDETVKQAVSCVFIVVIITEQRVFRSLDSKPLNASWLFSTSTETPPY